MVLFGGGPTTTALTAQKIDRLTFLTFNAGLLQFKCLGFSWYENPPFTSRRLKHIPIALRASEADIVCMQEVFDVTHANFIQSTLAMVYPYHARKSAGRIMSIDNGLLVLSKYPVVTCSYHPFEKITWSEKAFGSKGILSCLIDVPSLGKINILNVHMVSGTVDPESRSLDDIRLQEMAQVLRLANESALAGHAPLIVGDFNAGPTVCPSCYDHLLTLGWQDAFVAGRIRSSSATTTQTYSRANRENLHGPVRQHSARKAHHHTTSLYSSKESARPLTGAGGSVCGDSVIHSEISAPGSQVAKDSVVTTTAGSSSLEIAGGNSASSPKSCEGGGTGRWGSKLSNTRDSMARLIERMRISHHALNVAGDDGLGWTWDPKNPLNVLGPHSGCHGLRCDHLFLPPFEMNTCLRDFVCSCSTIIFDQPRVLVYSRWLKNCLCAPFYKCFNGGFGKKTKDHNRAPLLVTLSDHHAVKIILERCI